MLSSGINRLAAERSDTEPGQEADLDERPAADRSATT
jgi:hypothetical protein